MDLLRTPPPLSCGTCNEYTTTNKYSGKKEARTMVQIRRKNKVVIKPKKAEVTAVGRALRVLGGLGGGYVAGVYGAPPGVGSAIGHGLGAQLSRWLGQGDYTVRSNTLTRQTASGTIPGMHQNNQAVIVRHKEFITEVTGKTAFTVQRRFPLNPGVGTTFPWLSGVASQYSEYRIKGMVYHYVPTSGNAVSSTNAALGSVMLQTSYRANESQPTSKVEMLNEYWSNESTPSEAFVHPIECDPRENPFNIQYIRTGDVPSTDNILLYDLGVTTLAVSGQQANDIVLGDLWCTYEIELRKPKLTDLVGESTPGFAARSSTNINTTTPFGTNMAELFDGMVGGTTISSTVLSLAAGNVGTYQLTLAYAGTTAANLTSVAIAGTGSSLVDTVYAGATFAPIATTTQSWVMLYTFVVTNPNTVTTVTPTFSVLTGSTGLTATLTKINPSL